MLASHPYASHAAWRISHVLKDNRTEAHEYVAANCTKQIDQQRHTTARIKYKTNKKVAYESDRRLSRMGQMYPIT